MNFNKQEIELVEEALEATFAEVTQLTDLQMLLVGGGCGEVIFG
jgi:hypothetical protein